MSDTPSEWERIVACVNALTGISNPAAFVERAKAMEALLKRRERLLIQSACLEIRIFDKQSPTEIAALAAEWTPDA